MKSRATGEMEDNYQINLTERNILEGDFWPERVRVFVLKWWNDIEYQE